MSTVESKKMTLTPVKNISYEEAVTLAEKIAYIEAGVSKMKEHLKLYVKTNGPVEFGDSVWDQQPSQSWKWTIEAKKSFAEMLAIEGKNPWEFLSFSAGDLKKIGWSDEIIAQYAESKVIYSIRSKKIKR